MTAVVLTQLEVRRLLPMADAIACVADALAALARGAAENPLRRALRRPGGSILGTMPAALDDPPALGLKVVTVFPNNHGGPLDAHQGLVLLFDPATGAARAILDATEITAIRTAAASAVATRLLARADADDLALLGAGTQARTHLEATLCVRPIRRVRVHAPDPARGAAFARAAAARHGVEVEAVADARAAVDGAAIVCTTTSARRPVLRGAWLAPGTHVNAVGACTPDARELDGAAVARARLFVDRRESALAESGDFLQARAEGLVGDEHIVGELGELVLGAVPGRRDAAEVTLFESLGLGVEDVAVAALVHRRALAAGVGLRVDFGGLRDAERSG